MAGRFIPDDAGAPTGAPAGGAGRFVPDDNPFLAPAVETMERLMREADEGERARIAETKTPMGVVGSSATNSFMDNLLATPSVIADLASYPVRSVMAGMSPERPDVLGVTPRLKTEHVRAGARALGQGMSFGDALSSVQADDIRTEDIFPTSSMVGETIGDVATLATGKAPFAKGIRAREAPLAKRIEKAEDKAMYGSKVFTDGNKAAKQFFNKPIWKKMKRWGGRTMEAGAEGFVLGMLKEQDPVELATYTAGAQAAGGFVGGLVNHQYLPKRMAGNSKLVQFAGGVAVIGATLQGLSYVFPGDAWERDYEARSSAVEKALIATGVGLASGLAAGRARTGTSSAALPTLIDGLASVPRYTMQSAISQMMEKPPEQRAAYAEALKSPADLAANLSAQQLREWNSAVQKGGKAMVDWLDNNLMGQ